MALMIVEIQSAVAAYYGIPISAMRSQRRARVICRPRQVAMYLARELTAQTFPQIARRFERDHTTIMYGAALIERLVGSDAALAADVATLREQLELLAAA